MKKEIKNLKNKTGKELFNMLICFSLVSIVSLFLLSISYADDELDENMTKEIESRIDAEVKDRKDQIQQRSKWIEKNKVIEKNILQSKEDYPSYGERDGIGWVAAYELKSGLNKLSVGIPELVKKITNPESEYFIETHDLMGELNRIINDFKENYSDYIDLWKEKEQFLCAIESYNEGFDFESEGITEKDGKECPPEFAGFRGNLEALLKYSEAISSYPECTAFYIGYGATTRFLLGRYPKELENKLREDGIFEKTNERYKNILNRIGKYSDAKEQYEKRTAKEKAYTSQNLVNVDGLEYSIVNFEKWFPDFAEENRQVPLTIGEEPLKVKIYADGLFLFVRLKVKNLTQKKITLESSQFEIFDSEKRRYSVHQKAYFYLENKGRGLLKKVFAKSLCEGSLVFDIAVNAEGLKLKIKSKTSGKSSILNLE